MRSRSETVWVVYEQGPNGDHGTLCYTEGEANTLVDISKKWWEDMVKLNKVPERTYVVRRYISDG